MTHEQEFYAHLAHSGYRPLTVRLYRETLRLFDAFLVARGISDERNVRQGDVSDYHKMMDARDLSSHTVHGRLCRLERYFRYLEEGAMIFISPFRGYRMPKLVRTHHRALSAGETRWLLDSITADTPKAIRGRAILELAYSSALRPREVRDLKLSDIDYRKGLLFIEQSKNRKDRVVPVGDTAVSALRRYISEVRSRFIHEAVHPYVFISLLTGEQLTGSGLQHAVYQFFSDAGIEPIPLYSFRATAATNLLDAGMGVVHIAELLGHARITTTQIYLHTTRRELTKALEAHHPRFTKSKEVPA